MMTADFFTFIDQFTIFVWINALELQNYSMISFDGGYGFIFYGSQLNQIESSGGSVQLYAVSGKLFW